MRLFTTGLLLFFMSFLFAQTTHEVAVTSNVFTPNSLTIQVGDIVNWTNNGGFHNVNGATDIYPDNPEGFRSGNAAPAGWMFSHTFTMPGTYDYQCDPHVGLGMVGTIVVEEANTAVDNVVISEISYNPPESGADSLEFIEFVNLGPDAVNLTDWTMTAGVEFTFPAATLAAGEFMVLCVNEVAFMTVFPNYTATLLQWTGGGLSNGGENIAISNAAGVVVDEVQYDDNAPWPTSPDGSGTTLVLCDFASDNTSAFNWQAASTSTGVTINGNEFFANPGAASECGELVPTIFWNESSAFVNENAGTLTFQFTFQNFENGDVSAILDLDASSTATINVDFTPDSPASFPVDYTAAGVVSGVADVVITIVDDSDIESDETIVLSLTPNVGTITGDSLLTITVFDNDSEVVVTPIGDINDVDADGVAVSAGQAVTLEGVVHCIDFDGNAGYQFWIVDANGDGIFIFNQADVDDYVVTEGDLIQIFGEIAQFRGLLELVSVTQINMISQNNDLTAATEVTALEESLESVLVTLSGVVPNEDNPIFRAGGGFNISVVTMANDTVTLRLEDETGLDSMFVADWFQNAANGLTITGFVSQRDFDAPFDAFYQIYPCGAESFGIETSVNEPTWASDLEIYPNPTSGLLQINASTNLEVIRLVDLTGRELQRSNVNGEQQRLNISNLPTGTYFLQLISGNEVVTRPIVKQ